MLLRTSSAPLINSVFPQPPDTPRDTSSSSSNTSSSDLLPHHHHAASSSSPSSFAALQHPSNLHQRRPSADLHNVVVSSAPPSSDDRIPRRLLNRAQSEGDLACFSAAMSAVADEADALFPVEGSHGCKQWNRRLSLHRAASLEPGGSILEETEKDEDLDENTAPGKADLAAPDLAEGFLLNDGELYTSLNVISGGSPVACNAKGCRPLTASECKKLGLLNLAGGVGSGNGNGFLSLTANDGPDFSRNTDAYYQTMLQQNPSNPLLLGNYAQFLSDKGDLTRSEEYYERAILADPCDGEVLSHYAKLQWDVHKDKSRAEMYYDRAVEAAPDDCYVMASYASFLWDVEDNEDDISAVAASVPSHGGPSARPSVLLAPA